MQHLTAINHAISADFRRALAAAVVACLGLALTFASGGVLGSHNAPVAYFQRYHTVATICAIARRGDLLRLRRDRGALGHQARS